MIRLVEVGHGACAGTAGIAAAPTGPGAGGRTRCALCRDRKDRELGRQGFALALGAGRLLAAEYEGFKLMVALLADVLEDRHGYYRIYEADVAVLQF